MRLMFVYQVSEDTGSSHDIYNYASCAEAMGHDVVVCGPEQQASPLRYSVDVESVDAVIFVLEWCYVLHHGGHLNLVRLIGRVPRARRVVIDCDGMYNDVVRVNGDYNHPDRQASQYRVELCDALSDKIYQPTLHPLRPNVGTFLFHAYNPAWEVPLELDDKAFGMFYVGNNWFRWRAMVRVLEAIEPIRALVGRVGIAGYGWDPIAYWVEPSLREIACFTDPQYLRRLGVEVTPPVSVHEVVSTMSRGMFSPVLIRPIFQHLGLVTCRTFETLAAGTIPLFDLKEDHVKEIYGEEAVELVLGPEATDQILDVLERPEHYAAIVSQVRERLARHHSYARRLEELIQIVES